MGRLTDEERENLAGQIRSAMVHAYTTYGNAVDELKIRINEEAKQKEEMRKELFGLMIDCAFCFLPVGRILTKMVGKLSSIKGSLPELGQKVVDKVVTILANPESPAFKGVEDMVKEVLKGTTKIIPGDVLALFEESVEQDLDYADNMAQAFNVYSYMLGEDVWSKQKDRDAYSDEVLAYLLTKWHPINNTVQLNKSLVRENFGLYREFIACYREPDPEVAFDNTKSGTAYRLLFVQLSRDNSPVERQVVICRQKDEFYTSGSIKEGTRTTRQVRTFTIVPAPFAVAAAMSAYQYFKVENHPIQNPIRLPVRIGNLPSGKTIEEYANENTMLARLSTDGSFGTFWDRAAARTFTLTIDR